MVEQRKKLIKWATKRDRSPSQTRSEKSEPVTKRSREEAKGDRSEAHQADGTRAQPGDDDRNRTMESESTEDRSRTNKKQSSKEESQHDNTTGNDKIETHSRTKHKLKSHKKSHRSPSPKREKLLKSRHSDKERPRIKRCKYFKMRGHRLSKCVLCKNMNRGALQTDENSGSETSKSRSVDKSPLETSKQRSTNRSHSEISSSQSVDRSSPETPKLGPSDDSAWEEDEFYAFNSEEEWGMDSDVDNDDDWYDDDAYYDTYEEAEEYDEEWGKLKGERHPKQKMKHGLCSISKWLTFLGENSICILKKIV